ncbi:uncharacterized protein LOC100879003 isoform X4 [Megachile rotundata]|uniref:uncharacterized protein LOC100879003 isoform X4 n=1 Tax=Megachile rotundata TaxID=143995 RepID=UPI003FCF5F7A
MGATASSNGAPSPSAPSMERTEETFIRGTEESYCPEYTNENIRQRRRTGAFDVGEEPRSQGPSPYATFRGEEWWSQRPSAPSLSNLRHPRRETLLTYAAQMTGWQSAEGHSPSFSQETMELSRVISQLAMANQQLATAHAATLGHLETLYVELRKERESRRREMDVSSKKRLTIEEDECEEKRRLEAGDRLESDLDSCLRHRSCQDENRKLRSRIERLEMMMNRDLRINETLDVCDDSNRQIGCDKLSSIVPEEYRTSDMSRDLRVEGERSDDTVVNLHLKSGDECVMKSEDERLLREVVRLSEEVERLKAERLEYQSLNQRLEKELAEEKAVVHKLTMDYEESKTRHEKAESNLQEHREEYDKLMEKFDVAKKETERLLEEIDKFNTQKDTAEARISSLEQDLEKSLLEKEQIKSIESQKTLKLKAQLSEEVSDKKKQIKALEDALDEIQRLKETIKTEKKDDASKEEVGSIESTDDSQENSSAERATNLEEFKKELTLKREARQRAIAAVSSEMERLRRELDAEKEAHSETSRVLDLLRSAQNDPQAQTQRNLDENSKRSRMKDQKPDEHELAMKRIEAQRLASVLKVSDELRADIRFQIDKMDDLRYQLETEPDQHRYRIRSLAELTNKTREALHRRELRANELKDHLAQILVRLGDRSFLDPKDDVGLECERQLENIDSLKSLYNERLKVLSELKEAAARELVDVKERLDQALKKSECLEEDLRKADEKIDAQDTEITNLESQLGLTKADCRDLQNQMSLINGLFTQMLLGASSADMDLDRLTQLLQENHDLICDMAREEGTEAAALPKLLLDLIEQVEGGKGSQKRTDSENNGAEAEVEKKEEDLQQEDIAHNLPKESPRAPTPDTESEQPTDTELSESKTGSSATLEQRTSTPETEAELDEPEVTSELSNVADNSVNLKSSEESLDPLDQALTNVIQNLIAIEDSSPCKESEKLEIPEESQPNLESPKEDLATHTSTEVPSVTEETRTDEKQTGEKAKSEDTLKSSVSHVPSPASTQPVFSIGPFPPSIVTPATVKNAQFSGTPVTGSHNRFSAPVFGALTDSRFDTTQDGDPKEKRVDCDSVSVDSSSSMETVKDFSVREPETEAKQESVQESSGIAKQEEKKSAKTRTPEEVMAAREDRLKRLEEQAKWLMNKMNATSRRGSALSNRLEELHEVYGEPPVPPPMPDVLPARRLRTNLADLPRQVPESSEGTINIEKSVSNGGSDSP